MPDRPADAAARTPLSELAAVFLRLGLVSFGGPPAHVAMMDEEFVVRRRWITREEFLDLYGASQLIPGPNTTELACHIGRRRAGLPGLLVAGACFVLPAALIVSAIAWGYVRYGALPQAVALMAGVQPVVIALVAQAAWRLGTTALRGPVLVAVGLASVAVASAGVHELLVLLAAGLASWLARRPARGAAVLGAVAAGAATPTMASVAGAVTPYSLGVLFAVFFKIGATLFGSGYVLLAYLRADFVERLGWLSERQLLDAIAVGQVTPGPVFTTATFVGALLGGAPGAVAATVGVFAPAFLLVALTARAIAWMRGSRAMRAWLDGVNAASLALMVVVAWRLGRATLVDPFAWMLVAASAAALWRFRVNGAWLVVFGAAAGLARAWWRAAL